jgi:hypothetical protein
MGLSCKESIEILLQQKLCTLHLYYVGKLGIQLLDENYFNPSALFDWISN